MTGDVRRATSIVALYCAARRWTLHLCIAQHPLFVFEIQGWGPRASPLIIRCTALRSAVQLYCAPLYDCAALKRLATCGRRSGPSPRGAPGQTTA
eukprot:8308935-Pyramimonas_sp.AAC.1